jgi:hypothetical protein
MSSNSSDDGNNHGHDNTAAKSSSSSSWFGSWFDNDPVSVRNEIREKLNDFDEQKRRYEEQCRNKSNGFGGRLFGGMMPFFPDFAGAISSEKELQDFFEKMSDEMMSSSSSTMMSSSSSSSVTVRQSSRDGAQIDVQLPRNSKIESVMVDVVQEFPCVVQYRVESGGPKKNGNRPVQDRVRLGENIDCSKVSASLSASRNLLSVTAPVHQVNATNGEQQPRSIPVTEHDR